MSRKQARETLNHVLANQKTITVSKLNSLLDVLNYEQIEKQYRDTQRKVRRQKKELKKLEAAANGSN